MTLSRQPTGRPVTILCAGIAVQDILFRVDAFPPPGGKTMTNEMQIVCGGCAVNAAIAVARLGGAARYSGPLGDEADNSSNQLVAAMRQEGIDTSATVRVAGAAMPVSGIMIDATGERVIVTYRDPRIEAAAPPDPDTLVAGADLLLADNRFPSYVRPICEAARRRGIPVVLDADRPTTEDDPLFGIPTHVVFSSECLRATTGMSDLSAGLLRMVPRTEAFLAATGPDPFATSPAARCRPCRCSRSMRSTHWRPATCSTPGSRWPWRRAATSSRRCGSAPLRRGSSARSLAAAWAPPPGRRSRHS